MTDTNTETPTAADLSAGGNALLLAAKAAARAWGAGWPRLTDEIRRALVVEKLAGLYFSGVRFAPGPGDLANARAFRTAYSLATVEGFDGRELWAVKKRAPRKRAKA